MQYYSTRGQQASQSFSAVTLAGLAADGGLYLPQDLPDFSEQLELLRPLSYQALAFEIMRPFTAASLSEDLLKTLIEKTYGAAFRDVAITPCREIAQGDHILELFHGPTLAFKDIALQFLGNLFDALTAGQTGKPLTILGATSGDTGSAAIEGCRGRAGVRIIMLHPKGRVSDVQRRQMTTLVDENILNIAVEGSFDDCQSLVKQAFADHDFAADINLSAVNSINWSRVLAQIVYFAYAALRLSKSGNEDDLPAFSVPTGNFGDIFAGYLARRMGFPVGDLVIATNSNDILVRTRETGRYERGHVAQTLSPSMDIQISSNFERYLSLIVAGETAFEKSARLEAMMQQLATSGGFVLKPEELTRLRADFKAVRVSDADTLAEMTGVYEATGYVMDPHTAIGHRAFAELGMRGQQVCVTLATAHPAKFPAAVVDALTEDAATEACRLPDHLSGLMTAPESFETLPNNYDALKARIKRMPL